jgi:hypothetical protein
MKFCASGSIKIEFELSDISPRGVDEMSSLLQKALPILCMCGT